jgi:hypothetical protein
MKAAAGSTAGQLSSSLTRWTPTAPTIKPAHWCKALFSAQISHQWRPLTPARIAQYVEIVNIAPLLAKQTGKAPCYVAVWQAPRSVYAAYKAGRYEKATPAQLRAILKGRKLRIGTYGDGAAAPVEMWEEITAETAGHTGYSHQWKRPDFDHARWAPLVMASADNLDDAALANLYGMRVFRVSIGADKQPTEAICPASKEAGRRATCETCLLCAGTSKAARDIVIQDHATGSQRRVIQLQTA